MLEYLFLVPLEGGGDLAHLPLDEVLHAAGEHQTELVVLDPGEGIAVPEVLADRVHEVLDIGVSRLASPGSVDLLHTLQVQIAQGEIHLLLQHPAHELVQEQAVAHAGIHVVVLLIVQVAGVHLLVGDVRNDMDAGVPPRPLNGEGGRAIAGAAALLLPDLVALGPVPLQELGPDRQALAAALAERAAGHAVYGTLVAVDDLPGARVHHQHPLFPLAEQVRQHPGIAVDDPRPALRPLGLRLQLGFPHLQLLRHGVERIGELPQEGHPLGVIPLAHLTGLPGDMLEVGVEIFQVAVQTAAALREIQSQVALGQLGGVVGQILGQGLELPHGLSQLPAGLVQLFDVQPGLLRGLQNVPQVLCQLTAALVYRKKLPGLTGVSLFQVHPITCLPPLPHGSGTHGPRRPSS